MVRVRTEKKTTRGTSQTAGSPLTSFSNDLARIQIPHPDPQLSTAGALVLVKVRGASSPLIGFVGDGIDEDGNSHTPSGLALVNLNNLYRATTGESFDLRGDGSEDVSTRVIGGPQGYVTVEARVVPLERNLSEVVTLSTPSPCLGQEQVWCDGRLGDSNADGTIAIADADAIRDFVVGRSSTVACPVCADVDWDLRQDMTDALAIAQSVAGWRLLPW